MFSGCDYGAYAWKAIPATGCSNMPPAQSGDDWRLFLGHCEALLKAGGLRPSRQSIGHVAIQIARVSSNCYRAGLVAGARESSRERARVARVAKRKKADERGAIVQRAILSVCTQQRLVAIASEKFALSIQSEVIEAVRRFGLSDARSGTSSRTIQRHITAILKHGGMH
jgi:hypothetical protein